MEEFQNLSIHGRRLLSKIESEDTILQRKNKARWYHIKRTYGISEDEYNELLEEQSHKCGICKRHESEFTTKLAVDHDHQTGEVRGLLCNHCNRRVLGRHRDAGIFRNVAEYLERPRKGWKVPKKKRKPKSKRSRKTTS